MKSPSAPSLSVVIPVHNEEDNLPLLHASLTGVLATGGISAEILYVDDGSTDGSFEKLRVIAAGDDRVTVLRFSGRYGKSAALMAGFRRARGGLILTMDADLQDDPSELPRLLAKIEEGHDMVSGWKKVRHDPWLKVTTSRLFNAVTSWFTGVRLHDHNSGFKLYRAAAVQELDIYGELHRFIPALLGLSHWRVAEVPVQHHPRRHGRTKYGAERFINGFLDLMTVMFLTSYLKSPLHLFGRVGLAFFGSGFVINLYITWLRLATGSIQHRYPLLFLGVLLIIVGVQLVGTGLVAEMISKVSGRQVPRYRIVETLSQPGSAPIREIPRGRVDVS